MNETCDRWIKEISNDLEAIKEDQGSDSFEYGDTLKDLSTTKEFKRILIKRAGKTVEKANSEYTMKSVVTFVKYHLDRI